MLMQDEYWQILFNGQFISQRVFYLLPDSFCKPACLNLLSPPSQRLALRASKLLPGQTVAFAQSNPVF
jgi:hypothetical protein